MSDKSLEQDQAGDLRRIVEKKRQVLRQKGRPKTLAILSGKGGVGKSNVAIALACAFADKNKQVVLLDADLGMANLDILCGVSAKYNLSHLVEGSRTLHEILLPIEKNILLLPGGVGLREMADLDDDALSRIFETLSGLEQLSDLLILDVGAGIHKGVRAFAQAADTTVLVTTPEPTSIRDAYGVIKSLGGAHSSQGGDLMLIVNMANNQREAYDVAERIRMASMQFLGSAPIFLGYILKDSNIERAVRMRRAFYRLTPSSAAAVCVRKITDEIIRLWEGRPVKPEPKGLRAFFAKLTRGLFKEK